MSVDSPLAQSPSSSELNPIPPSPPKCPAFPNGPITLFFENQNHFLTFSLKKLVLTIKFDIIQSQRSYQSNPVSFNSHQIAHSTLIAYSCNIVGFSTCVKTMSPIEQWRSVISFPNSHPVFQLEYNSIVLSQIHLFECKYNTLSQSFHTKVDIESDSFTTKNFLDDQIEALSSPCLFYNDSTLNIPVSKSYILDEYDSTEAKRIFYSSSFDITRSAVVLMDLFSNYFCIIFKKISKKRTKSIQLRPFNGRDCVAFSCCNEYLFTGEGQSLLLYSIDSGKILSTLQLDSEILSLTAHEEFPYVVCGLLDGDIVIISLFNNSLRISRIFTPSVRSPLLYAVLSCDMSTIFYKFLEGKFASINSITGKPQSIVLKCEFKLKKHLRGKANRIKVESSFNLLSKSTISKYCCFIQPYDETKLLVVSENIKEEYCCQFVSKSDLTVTSEFPIQFISGVHTVAVGAGCLYVLGEKKSLFSYRLPSGELLEKYSLSDNAKSISFYSPNFVVCGLENGNIDVLATEEYNPKKPLILLKTLASPNKTSHVYSAILHSKGSKLIAGYLNGDLIAFSMRSGSVLWRKRIHSNQIYHILPIGVSTYITCSYDKTVKLYNPKLDLVVDLATFSSYVSFCLFLSPSLVACCSNDKTIQIIDLHEEQAIKTILCESGVYSLSKIGPYVYTAESKGVIEKFDFDSNSSSNNDFGANVSFTLSESKF